VECPVTPTPIAVPGSKAQAAQAPILAMPAIAVLSPVLTERPPGQASIFELGTATTVDVVDLTCARLC
jgi:hypothetical protein